MKFYCGSCDAQIIGACIHRGQLTTSDGPPDYIVGVSGKEWTRLSALVPTLESDLARLAAENASLRKVLKDITEEEVMSGQGVVNKYHNPLTASLRNLAIEALELAPSEHVARIETRLELAGKLADAAEDIGKAFADVGEDMDVSNLRLALRAFREGV